MCRAFGILIGLFFVCSCATKTVSRLQLPADVTMNPEAGRGGWLIVPVRLEDGQELPFLVDTGAGSTILDLSLVPKLGARLGSANLEKWDSTNKVGVYAAPKLYLKNIPLMITGSRILADDLSTNNGGYLIKGVLGIDVLEHYCIQLDFAAGKMRFLDGARANKQQWGKAFPLLAAGACDARPAVSENLFGARDTRSLIDTGFNESGWLQPKFYQQWTNRQTEPRNGEPPAPDSTLNGDTYRGVYLIEKDFEYAGIGLLFLSRHLVTFDFPNQTMYLKRTWNSYGPLIYADMIGALGFLRNLQAAGRLPDFAGTDEIIIEGPVDQTPHFHVRYPNTITCILRKKNDPSFYFYIVFRKSIYGPWKLQKAWKADRDEPARGLTRWRY